jgi:outer membrane protein OmpA-like peptidoglycan-associated protein
MALTMAGQGDSLMNVRKLGGAIAGVVMLWSGAAAAQGITEVQIINGLQGGPAVTVVIDPNVLMAEVNANVGKGASALPTWAQLAKLTQLVVDIEFEYNSTAIVPNSYRTLGAIADALHHPLLARYSFLVVGHTDATGGADYNLKLSLARSQAIRDALVTTFTVAPKRLIAVGVGEELPLDPGNPDAAINRRVQLVNIGETPR